MWKCLCIVLSFGLLGKSYDVHQRSKSDLLTSMMENCVNIDCVKNNVLKYFDNVLGIKADSVRSIEDIDGALLRRVSKLLRTNGFKVTLPEMLFGPMQLIYNPASGLDIYGMDTESRGLLKKKLLFPLLLVLKLKMKALMPIFVALIGLKSLKALILSKLAIVVVFGFIIYQFCIKAGMPMPMMNIMTPPTSDLPASMYGTPTTTPTNSYEPNWEPSSGGPYARIWTANKDKGQLVAYSAHRLDSIPSSTLGPY